ncbi:OmpA family protein [Motiliproteus sp. MSK22-1]|uniref:OmpA family protein n=1 Tax=Motiliproteus sp. MSK22-1 TaxID=1897630 RepID=UPI000976D9D3|nr:OmpA family protein [Motiliproteus sp. MSK22-1]OMH39345.1 hypothetical protein BGP75_03255 [Motiliproteus sp. MSK22-1]
MKKMLITSAVVAMFSLPVAALAHDTGKQNHDVYWHDSNGVFVKDSNGDCVRGKDWFAGSRVEGCDDIPAPMVTPSDSDGDGVVDVNDKCPNTPAGVLVDRDGCPLDSDNDGVPNYKDKCLRTPPGATVDVNGCEIKAQVLMEVNLNVYFALDSAVVTRAYDGEIARVADFMKKAPGSLAYIEGHTDSTGKEAYNQQLSLRRAQAVANDLVNKYGIAKNRVKAEGYGETRPVASNKTKEGRRENRRVVAVVKGMVEK